MPAAGGGGAPPTGTGRPLSKRREWAFRVAALLLMPLLLGMLELGLRIGGYGYPTDFFKPLRIGKEELLVENDKFGLRFFSPELSRSPAPVVIKAHKPAGTYRIFLFGESAALGDPRPAFGAGRYLQALLRERYPGTEFEVVCVAMTAINSHAILPMARECAKREGDLWVIYMGNNEMVGPFGATTVFGSQSPPLGYVRLSVAVQRTRLGQLLLAVGRKLTGRSAPGASWGGMKMFLENRVGPTDPRKEIIYRNFQRNLNDILNVGRKAGVPVVLNTMAVNLRDCPPFASVPATNLPAAEQQVCRQLFLAGVEAESKTNLPAAVQSYTELARLDPNHAESQFRLGRCLLQLTNAAGAWAAFEQSRDDDALPFRADSRINRTLLEAARNYADRGSGGGMAASASAQKPRPSVVLCDAAAWFATNSPAGIPGHEYFYEHVHFNFDGNYRLGRAWAEQVRKLLPTALTQQDAGDWASQATCERRLGLTDWNRYGVYEDLARRLTQAPFINQLDQEQRRKDLDRQIRELRQHLDGAAATEARELYLEALKRSPKDHRLHENFAEFLEATGDLPKAVAEWEQVRALIPHHHLAWFKAGQLLLRQAKLPAARQQLGEAVRLRPDLGEGWLELGQSYAVEGKHELALQNYERAQKLLSPDPRVYYHIGRAYSNLKQRREAIAQLSKAIELRPAYWEAHYALGEELGFAGKVKEARSQFEEVIRLKPDYAAAHFNLGVSLAVEGRLDEATKQFEETQRLDPKNKQAGEYLEKLRKYKELRKEEPGKQ